MTRRVLLVEIGTPAELPVVTPPAPRPPSAWVPDPRPSPGLPPPTGLAAVSIADAAVLSWTPSTAGGQTIVEAAPDVAGVPGIWREIARVGGDTYTISLPGGPRWVRVRAELNGRTSVATNAVLAEPVPVGDISEFEQELRDLQDLVDAVAAQAAADAAALNVRADDLRADIDDEITRALAAEEALSTRADGLRSDVDNAIADISTLSDTTDGLATEIQRVESESVGRDTATAETIALLGATNGAGTAFMLDGNTVRVSPTETLAQWRSSIQGEFASQSSRIDNEVQALQDADQALATTLATVQATANNAATKAELTAAQSALASAIAAEAGRIGAIEVRVPAGTDQLANEARVVAAENAAATANAATASTLALLGAKNAAGTAFILDGNTVRLSPTESLAQWRNSIQGEFASQSSRIDNEVQALQDADQALATTLAAVQATANNAATKAELTSAQNALAAENQALSERLDVTQASIGQSRLLMNPDFEQGAYGWQAAGGFGDNNPDAALPANVEVLTSAIAHTGSRVLRVQPTASTDVYNSQIFAVGTGDPVNASVRFRTHYSSPAPAGTIVTFGVRWYAPDGAHISWQAVDSYTFGTSHNYYFTNDPLEGEISAPAGAGYGRIYLNIRNFQGAPGPMYFDAARASRGSLAATASDLALVRTDVQQQGDTLTAHALRLDSQQTAIEGKASTSYVQSVEGTASAAAAAASAAQGTADSAASQASANLTAITGLTATAGGHTASIQQLMEVSAAANDAGGVGILDPSFERADGWGTGSTTLEQRSTTLPPATVYQNNASNSGYSYSGTRSLRFNAHSSIRNAANNTWFRVTPGRRYRVTYRYRTWSAAPPAGSYIRPVVYRWRPDGSYVAFSAGPSAARIDYDGSTTHGWRTVSAIYTVPGDDGIHRWAMQAQLLSGSAAILIDDFTVEPIDLSLEEVLASYVLAMNAGGKFAGVKYLNDGSVSNATFLFDNFDFETADGSFRISDGRTITRSNGYMRVEGKPFGQNNEMVVWYGPEQSNLANCRRNNAISFETNNGLHYSIGAMFSGTISAGGYTTAIAATHYSTGAFGTNGGPIVVNASFTHSRQQLGGKQQSPNWQKNTISAGSGTTSATIELWRRIGTGNWQLVASATREGVLSIQSSPGEPDIDDVAQWNNTVSLTYTDNAGGTQNRDFEVRVIQNVYQGIVISGSAPVPPPTDSRSLGVRTSE